ncbi:hypothetical protein BASA60_007375 [Batrachochytrium salamandrivorans]|nr:hypothetical protein BASA60_007375 [Batrachochytrium salamandrivorans]
MNEGAFIGSSQSAGDEAPVKATVPHNARDSQTEPKRGRVSSMVWELYTNEKDVHMKIACVCQHCGHQIVHRKKSERAISHLLRCNPFLKEMMLLDPINRPDWFNNAKANKRKTTGARSSAGISQSSSQTGSILQYTLPKLMKRDLTKIEEVLAMHYYLTGTAFSRIEEENLLSAFRICRPDIVLPDRKKLGGALLDSCYAKVKSVVDNHIEEMKLNACLTSDAWSNIKNEPIVNYMLISDSSTFFLESVSTGEQSHDAKWIAQDMGRIIDSLAGKVCGAVTDNTTTNRSAWSMLKKKYPSLFFQGCASHGLHLLVKDIFAATKTKRGREVADYPENYPFHYLLEFSQKCKDVVSFFSFHHQMKAQLQKAQLAENLPGLVQPAPTRWGSLKACFESLRKSEHVLHRIVSARDFIQGTGKQKESQQKINDIITEGKFVENLDKAIMILNPVDTTIVVFQSDSVPVSQIYQSFANTMKEQYEMMNCLSDAERLYLLQLLQSRLDFLYGDAIGIAYLLDPRPITTRIERMFRFLMLEKGTKTILQFWLVDGLEFPQLRDLALQVSVWYAQVPRQRGVFPPWGFAHSKPRSSLGSEKVKKLVYIKTNASQFGNQNMKDLVDTETESESEVERD